MLVKFRKRSNKYCKIKVKDWNKNNHDIDLHGLDIETALDKLDYYLTNICFFKQKEVVHINHGKGEFKLATAIHDYLNTLPIVNKYEFASYYKGGRGVTVVYLDL